MSDAMSPQMQSQMKMLNQQRDLGIITTEQYLAMCQDIVATPPASPTLEPALESAPLPEAEEPVAKDNWELPAYVSLIKPPQPPSSQTFQTICTSLKVKANEVCTQHCARRQTERT